MIQINEPVWHKYLPEYVYLTEIDREDNLDSASCLQEECVKANSLLPLMDYCNRLTDDRYNDNEYLEEIRKKMYQDGKGKEYNDFEEEIKDWLWDNNKSEPVEDALLRNSHKQDFYYTIDLHTRNIPEEICRALDIDAGTEAANDIFGLCDELQYDIDDFSEFRIYFSAKFDDLVYGNKYEEEANKSDWLSIRFNGEFVIALWNEEIGVGNFAEIRIDKEFLFIRQKLHISDQQDIYDLPNACGLDRDWLDEYDTPTLNDDLWNTY